MSTYSKIRKIVKGNIGNFSSAGALRPTCVYLSELAYWKPSSIIKYMEELNPVKYNIYHKDGTQAIFVEFDDIVYVAFSGINLRQWDDIKITLRFWKTEFLNTKVHNGFSRSMDRISDNIIKDLREARGKKVVYTGHSLGGAMATLMSMLHKPDEAYVFGSPPVSSGAVYMSYFRNIDFYNIVHRLDYIQWLPPKLFGYFHVGKRVVYSGPERLMDSHDLIEYIKTVMNEHDGS